MPVLKLLLTMSGAFALLALAAMYRASATSQATTAVGTHLQTPAAVVTRQANQEWTFQVDAPTLSENLNAWAATQAALQTPLGAARLQRMTVDIRANQLVVRGIAGVGWLSVPVDAAVTASIQGGSLQVHVMQAHVNGVDMPESARLQLEQQLQNQIAQSIDVHRVVVRSVHLGDGMLAISGARL